MVLQNSQSRKFVSNFSEKTYKQIIYKQYHFAADDSFR